MKVDDVCVADKTVTITLSRDELWAVRDACFEAWRMYKDQGYENMANDAYLFRDITQQAFDILYYDELKTLYNNEDETSCTQQ